MALPELARAPSRAGAIRYLGEVIRREFDATRINEVLNDPSVRPWVADATNDLIDISRLVENRNNFLLMGEFGGCLFVKILPGIYEVHTQVLKSGRGEWARNLSKACAHYIFTKSDAHEILTRVPRGHVAAKIFTLLTGFRYEHTATNSSVFRGRTVDVDIYRRSIQEWMAETDGLVETGKWFHRRLNEEADRLGVKKSPHGNDDSHNRYVGAAYAAIIGGQMAKGVAIYNRWAIPARHDTIALVSKDPPKIKFDLGYLDLTEDNDIRVTLQ